MYFSIWLFGGAKYQGKYEAEAKGTDEQPLSDKLPLRRWGESYSAWQYWFKGTAQSLLLKRWKKNLLHFVFLNKKQEKKGGWRFCGEFRSLLSKLIFTHSAFCWSCSHGVETECSSFLTNANQFRTYDLRKYGNSKAVYLSFHRFADSWTRGFELITHGFELLTLGFELVTRGF